MANTTKHIAPGARAHSAPMPFVADQSGSVDVRLSPHVEALRRLVAAGQYQVSPRFLAQRILRTAGIKVE